jgi:uncharacterized protein YbaR (Trm112 family)
MSKQKLDILCAVCPYCDGENVIGRVQAGLDSIDREIACKYCRSLFTLAESKPRIRSLFKQERGAA